MGVLDVIRAVIDNETVDSESSESPDASSDRAGQIEESLVSPESLPSSVNGDGGDSSSGGPPASVSSPGLTLDDVREMRENEINERWDEISELLEA